MNHDINTNLMPSDFEKLDKGMREMNSTFEGFMERVDKRLDQNMEIEEDIKLLLILLKGNKHDKQDTGLIGLINDLVARVEKLERIKDGAIKWVAGFSFGAGALITYIISKLLVK